MINDILYSEQFLVFETPITTAAGYNDVNPVQGISYDGDNYMFTQGGGGEIISVFVN